MEQAREELETRRFYAYQSRARAALRIQRWYKKIKQERCSHHSDGGRKEIFGSSLGDTQDQPLERKSSYDEYIANEIAVASVMAGKLPMSSLNESQKERVHRLMEGVTGPPPDPDNACVHHLSIGQLIQSTDVKSASLPPLKHSTKFVRPVPQKMKMSSTKHDSNMLHTKHGRNTLKQRNSTSNEKQQVLHVCSSTSDVELYVNYVPHVHQSIEKDKAGTQTLVTTHSHECYEKNSDKQVHGVEHKSETHSHSEPQRVDMAIHDSQTLSKLREMKLDKERHSMKNSDNIPQYYGGKSAILTSRDSQTLSSVASCHTDYESQVDTDISSDNTTINADSLSEENKSSRSKPSHLPKLKVSSTRKKLLRQRSRTKLLKEHSKRGTQINDSSTTRRKVLVDVAVQTDDSDSNASPSHSSTYGNHMTKKWTHTQHVARVRGVGGYSMGTGYARRNFKKRSVIRSLQTPLCKPVKKKKPLGYLHEYNKSHASLSTKSDLDYSLPQSMEPSFFWQMTSHLSKINSNTHTPLSWIEHSPVHMQSSISVLSMSHPEPLIKPKKRKSLTSFKRKPHHLRPIQPKMSWWPKSNHTFEHYRVKDGTFHYHHFQGY